MRSALVMLVAWAVSVEASAQGAAPAAPDPAPDPAREVIAAGIPGVVAPGTRTELVRAGFDGTEGVISMPDGSVLFCEINTDRIIHLDANGQASVYLEGVDRALGLGYDPNGRLVAAQSRDPRIAVIAPVRKTLADSFDGQPLVRPNDLVIDRRGGIYFTDPLPSRQLQFREPPAGRKPLLFHITPDGRLRMLTDAVAKPNGIQLSGDQKVLYAVDGDQIVAFDVQADGSVGAPRKFADVPGGDGLALDSQDRLYVANQQGVQVLDATGRFLGTIPAPVRIQSIAFAGPGRKTLYAVGQGAVYRIPLLVAGVRGRAK